jgi:hypothetical protein
MRAFIVRLNLPWMLALSLGCPTSPGHLPDRNEGASRGLKIFVTSRVHGADFANDPFLSGADAIQKADDFCNTDPNHPGQGTYGALIVDGVIRDAKTRTNWVLQPTTTYYRTDGDVEIGTTTETAIFATAYKPLTNPVEPPPASYEEWLNNYVWTGLATATDFSAAAECCAGWSDMTSSVWFTTAGAPYETGADAFALSTQFGCRGVQFHLYCVEQP